MKILDLLKRHQISNDKWVIYYEFGDDGNIIFISIDMTYENPKDQIGFQTEFFIRIRIPEHKLNDNIISDEEQEFQILMEENFCNRLVQRKINCKQVLRLTFSDQKQYVFECNDVVEFKEEFNQWKDSFDKEYQVELNEHKSFEYYSELLPDKCINQQLGNELLINKLESIGCDLDKEHFIEHRIFGPKENLENIIEAIKKYSFTIISYNHDHLEIGKHCPLNIYSITYQTDYLIDICDEFNCEYDGWSTMPIK